MEILKLSSGNPDGSGELTDYEFEAITVDGDIERNLKEQLNQWVLVNTYTIDKMTDDGDCYGSGNGGIYETNLLKLSERCFMKDGILLGYKTDNMILFLNGKALGRVTYRSYDDGDREIGEYSLKRIVFRQI